MKKLLIILLLIAPAFVFAQTDTTKNTNYEKYCVVKVRTQSFSTKINMFIDFGQEYKYTDPLTRVLMDGKGHLRQFNSIADGLNYMATQGWLLVNAYFMGEERISYIMRKPAQSN